MKRIILAITIVCTLSLTLFASAQGLKGASGMLEKVGGANGENIGVTGDLPTAISTVIKAVLSLVGTIFLVLTIYAGIMWMTAQGDDERSKKAMSIISMAVIGLIITMSAYAITYFVTSKLGSLSSSTPEPKQRPLPLGMPCEFDNDCDSGNCKNNECARAVIDL